ncbi:MAG: two pore domain potassium channel family protein [Ruminococcus sp.]|nr:two pore domain potassium channel family protein [Ruminococcus sp.]
MKTVKKYTKQEMIHKSYDIIMSVLAIAISVLILLDATEGLGSAARIVFLVFYALFFADVVTRFSRAKNKKKFFKRNYFDLLALVPIHGIIPMHTGTLSNVLRVIGLLRIVAFLARPLRKVRSFFNTNGFKYVVFATVMTIITGGVLIHYAEGMGYGDGIWWAFVTATTVGYGDISPGTTYGRLIAMVLMLVGIGLIGSLTSTLTSFFLSRQKRSASRAVINTVKEELDRFDDLTPEEVDKLCSVLKSLKK